MTDPNYTRSGPPNQADNASNEATESLKDRHCVPCEGGVATIQRSDAEAYLGSLEGRESLDGWELSEDGKFIEKRFNGRTFLKVIDWVNRIAEVSEAEQHHPDLHITGYRHLTVQLTTHAIDGLSENDLILAAKIEETLK